MTRVAVVGVGAVGGVVAAGLMSTGRLDVTACVRSPLGGLRIERPDGSALETSVPEVTDPAELSPVEWVVLATKAYQTPAAAPWLSRLCGPTTRVAVLQNGVEHRERVAPLAGPARIVPAVVEISAESQRRGQARLFGPPRLTVPGDEDGADFAALCQGSGIEVTPVDDFVTAAWAKLCLNAANGAVTALTMHRMPVFAHPRIAQLGRALVEEARQVALASGARLPADLADQVLTRLRSMPPESGSSMLWDRLAGRQMEYDARNGAVVRAGARLGIPTPYNETVTALLEAVSAPANPS
ncbi:2-dehydropantoate 2-reductase [Streptomyces sp. SKN60]|uniref:2-dehydropantoate 2-reductase n=1 Tax=Streptomyces sp. SKN60 TaxID=2855506 RepID=UPI002248594E|nr:2-dehydropantoate 2-reductase [Streptomyces sp. SKN60]MCX2184089.1 2-dehydropantoate 2-reductase [Streptomyces sp. SKN60]